MDNKNISTKLGVIILVIFAVTVLAFLMIYEKNRLLTNVPFENKLDGSQVSTEKENSQSSNNELSKDIIPVMPKTPTLIEESEKTPVQLVEDFYEWYIGIINYRSYQLFTLHQKTNLIDINNALKESPFISSGYIHNMQKRKGNYDNILCTNDTENNIVEKYEQKQIGNDVATVEILRGYSSFNSTTKIKIFLKKEGQWKINDIECNF